MSTLTPRLPCAARRTTIACFGALLLTVASPLAPDARAQDPVRPAPVTLEQRARILHLKRLAIMQMQERARARLATAHRAAAAKRPWWRKALGLGTGARDVFDTTSDRLVPQPEPMAAVTPMETEAVSALAPNVRANNTAGDAANAGQAEESIATLGSRMLVAWNDGQGFVGNTDVQGFAWSNNGGATFTDGGVPPKPAGFPSWKWTSDPVVAVNEKTGKFYYAGMAKSDATHNAIGIVSGSFNAGGTFVWDTARVVRNVADADYLLDKPWIAADSSANFVYVTMTTFDATTPANWIDFQRSLDGGRTWTAAETISSYETDGLVQGSRIVPGPNATVYAAWQAIGDTIQYDYFKVAKSTNRGATWNFEVTAVAYLSNFGTGPPGYNRERGIHYPSLAVDRTRGMDRGRVWLAWNESFNHLDDVFGFTAKSEVEPNGTWANATPFTPGDILRGQSSTTSDADFFRCTLTQGQSLIVWADSLIDNATYTVRLYAPSPDTLQQLAYGGDLTSNPGQDARETYFVFTAPKTGVYSLRMLPVNAQSLIGNWRIRTTLGAPQAGDRARDMRDIFVSSSPDGDSWSTPVRVNDDLARFDDSLPEIVVGPDGCPWVTWRDTRRDASGSRSHQFVSRSCDQGQTWEPNLQLTTAIGNFSAAASNLIPNQGDYNGLTSDSLAVAAAWADGRGASVDVWTQRVEAGFAISRCPPDTTITAGSEVWVEWAHVTDLNVLHPNTFEYTMSSQRNWPLPSGSLTIPRDKDTLPLRPLFYVPDTAKAGKNRVCLNLRNVRRSRNIYCCANITIIPGGLAVDDAPPDRVWLGPPTPSPARGTTRLSFRLPIATGVRLEILDPEGRRVRTLVQSILPPGEHGASWDGRDDDGRLAAPGVYYSRLQAAGRSLTRTVVRVR